MKNILPIKPNVLKTILIIAVLITIVFIAFSSNVVNKYKPLIYKKLDTSEIKFQKNAVEVNRNEITDGILYVEYRGVYKGNILFKTIDSKKLLRIQASRQNFSYGCTNQNMDNQFTDTLFLDKVKQFYFLQPEDLDKVLNRGDTIIIAIGKLNKEAKFIVSARCMNE